MKIISLILMGSISFSTHILKITIDYGDSTKITEYHKNDSIKSEGLKIDNFKHGKWKYYDDKGFLTKIENYRNGRKIRSKKLTKGDNNE